MLDCPCLPQPVYQ